MVQGSVLYLGPSFASFCHHQHGSSSCRYKPTFWSNLSLRAMSEGRVPRSDWSANVQAMRCGLLPGRRKRPHLQKAPWRHVIYHFSIFHHLQSLLCLWSFNLPMLLTASQKRSNKCYKKCTSGKTVYSVDLTIPLPPRCPDNSRTLQRGSLSFTDCGCEVGYINVANVTVGLLARWETLLEMGGLMRNMLHDSC